MVVQFAVAAVSDRRNLLNPKRAVRDRRYEGIKLYHYQLLKSLDKPFLIFNQELPAACGGIGGLLSTSIHFFPEKTTTSTPATTARPGMATIWTSW